MDENFIGSITYLQAFFIVLIIAILVWIVLAIKNR